MGSVFRPLGGAVKRLVDVVLLGKAAVQDAAIGKGRIGPEMAAADDPAYRQVGDRRFHRRHEMKLGRPPEMELHVDIGQIVCDELRDQWFAGDARDQLQAHLPYRHRC